MPEHGPFGRFLNKLRSSPPASEPIKEVVPVVPLPDRLYHSLQDILRKNSNHAILVTKDEEGLLVQLQVVLEKQKGVILDASTVASIGTAGLNDLMKEKILLIISHCSALASDTDKMRAMEEIVRAYTTSEMNKKEIIALFSLPSGEDSISVVVDPTVELFDGGRPWYNSPFNTNRRYNIDISKDNFKVKPEEMVGALLPAEERFWKAV